MWGSLYVGDRHQPSQREWKDKADEVERTTDKLAIELTSTRIHSCNMSDAADKAAYRL